MTPLPVLDPAQPPLVLPDTNGLAIDDANTALLHEIRTRLVRRSPLSLLTVALMAVFLATSIAERQFGDEVLAGIVIVLLLGMLVFAQSLHRPQLRWGNVLLNRYPWQGVPATLLADRPCLARITLDGREVTLRLRRLNWIGKQALARTGALWICGPDERGRALVRIAGSVGQALATVTDATPTGVPPVPARPSGPRPGDDPALIWGRHAFNRTMMITIAILVLLDAVVIGVLTRTSLSMASGLLIGAVVNSLGIVMLGWSWFTTLRQYRRLAAAQHWLPVPVSLDTWDSERNRAVRTGTGRIILPGGWRCYVEFPRLQLDFAANLRATGVLWLAGDAAPGQTVPIGLPGFPLRGVVKIKP